MIAKNEDGTFLAVACDTCGSLSPPAREIMQAFGLVRLGWHCTGGTHICPSCPHPTKPL